MGLDEPRIIMPTRIVFTHPEPTPSPTRIWPVFIPFAGCPYRCAFCAQDKQTGQTETGLKEIFQRLKKDLATTLAQGRGPYELAFYGGTFTALPAPWPDRFLGLAMHYRRSGLITHVRCSTRPDCVDEPSLAMLRAKGLDMVELGIQSFDDSVLRTSGRGYTGDTARLACKAVKDSGMDLGIQLLPGLPGDRPGVFKEDVIQTASFTPKVARLYPCLVIRGTLLARKWQQGEFDPWELSRTKKELAEALPLLWNNGIRIIRLGLPPEGTMTDHILAGPWHPALGQSVRGLALQHIMKKQLARLDGRPRFIDIPRRYQGEFMGHGNELAAQYTQLGVTKKIVRYGNTNDFILTSQ